VATATAPAATAVAEQQQQQQNSSNITTITPSSRMTMTSLSITLVCNWGWGSWFGVGGAGWGAVQHAPVYSMHSQAMTTICWCFHLRQGCQDVGVLLVLCGEWRRRGGVLTGVASPSAWVMGNAGQYGIC